MAVSNRCQDQCHVSENQEYEYYFVVMTQEFATCSNSFKLYSTHMSTEHSNCLGQPKQII